MALVLGGLGLGWPWAWVAFVLDGLGLGSHSALDGLAKLSS